SMNPFYTSHRIGQLILKRSALTFGSPFLCHAWRKPLIIRLGSVDVRHTCVDLRLIKMFLNHLQSHSECLIHFSRCQDKESPCEF
ncbi:hypothetical protein DXU84_24570, partial [Rahnella sp. RcJ3]|nr:hypothetical protein [Rahnella sp. RcJ3]